MNPQQAINIGNALRGKKKSKEHVLNISKALKGRSTWNKGIPMSQEAKMKMISKKKGISVRSGYKLSDEHKEKLSQAKLKNPVRYWKGRKRLSMTGQKHFRWNPEAPENQKQRLSSEYKEWRNSVYERDNYTCAICNERGGKLNADHILRFSLYPDLRFNVNNGQTLCKHCHLDKTRNELKNNHKNQFSSWVKA